MTTHMQEKMQGTNSEGQDTDLIQVMYNNNNYVHAQCFVMPLSVMCDHLVLLSIHFKRIVIIIIKCIVTISSIINY